MTASGDWEEDMERFALDPDTADRLLSGSLDPEDAPHRYGEVASLLRIAAGPTSGALDGEAAAVPAVVEAIRSSPSPAPQAGSPRARRGIRLKAATGGVVAVLVLTGSLAAADALPAPAQRVASDALSVVGVDVPSPSSNPAPSPRSPAEPTASHGAVSGSTSTTGSSATTATTGRARTPSTVLPTPPATAATASSQPGAGAGRTEATTAPASNPQSGPVPEGTPATGAVTGSNPSAAPTPTSTPPPEKQAARTPSRQSGGANGTDGANGSAGTDGASGGTQAGPERLASTSS